MEVYLFSRLLHNVSNAWELRITFVIHDSTQYIETFVQGLNAKMNRGN